MDGWIDIYSSSEDKSVKDPLILGVSWESVTTCNLGFYGGNKDHINTRTLQHLTSGIFF